MLKVALAWSEFGGSLRPTHTRQYADDLAFYYAGSCFLEADGKVRAWAFKAVYETDETFELFVTEKLVDTYADSIFKAKEIIDAALTLQGIYLC